MLTSAASRVTQKLTACNAYFILDVPMDPHIAKQSTYDCIVVGSGPGGAPIAWRLAAKGMEVLLLEAGRRYDPYKDYALARDDWELQTFPYGRQIRVVYGEAQKLDPKYHHLKSWMASNRRMNPSSSRRYFRYHHVVGLGGTTLHYQGEAHRLHPKAFKTKSHFGYGADWPISYEDLEPYYTEVERILGVAGPAKQALRPRSAPYPLPPHRLSYASFVIGKAARKLGLTLEPNSLAILSRPYADAPSCNYCNGCVWGCPRKDKGSVDVRFIPLAERTGRCRIVTGAAVRRVEIEEKGGRKRAVGVVWYDENGKRHMARGGHVVVACGAVETPRLLINSGITAGGNVGKNFMETVSYITIALHPERLDSYRGLPIDSIIWDWNEPSVRDGLQSGLRLYPTAGSAMGPVSYALRYHRGWGQKFVDEVRRWFGHAIGVAGIAEFVPNDKTFVGVSEKAKDEFGYPLPLVQSHLGEPELKALDFMYRKSRELLEAAGAEEFVEGIGSYDFFSASHVFGTCRMGTDPETSVVGPDLRCHEVDNLLVTDASVFPTSGGGESPSLTIEALSLRAADLLIKSLSGRG